MSAKLLSAGTLSRLAAVMVGLMILAGCGGGSSSSSTTSTGTPAVTLSPTTLTFTSGVGVTTAQQIVSVTNSGTATLNFSGFTVSSNYAQTNTCGTSLSAGSVCSVSVTFTPTAAGSDNGTLSIADNASGSPQSVALTGTGTAASVSPASLSFSDIASGSTSTAQTITLGNASSSALSVTSITASASFSETNNCGASVAANGSCTINVTFSPTSNGMVNGTLTIVDGSGTQTVSLTGSTTVANTAALTVNFGPNGYLGPPAASATSETLSYYNDITTTVTVCQPGNTANCVTVPNVLVDTGSVGLRVLASAVSGLNLTPINDATTGYPLYECVQYGDLSYTWGPMEMAGVQVGGETASQIPASSGGTANAGIPIQVISSSGTPPANVSYEGSEYANPCLVYPGTSTATDAPDDNTVATLGTNGILGIGVFPQDCGGGCTSLADTTGQYIAYQSSSGAAYIEATPLTSQAWNPVVAFPTDNNGESISLSPIPAAGAASATGTLTFGINTQTNNQLPGTAQVYEVDDYGYFGSATYNGVTYTSSNSYGSFIDSGSNSLYISDPTVLSTTDCTVSGYDIGLYCPSSPLNLSLGLAGTNGTSTTVSLPVENALNLFSANTQFAAFNDLAGPSCVPTTDYPCSTAADSWDLGLPFFFDRGTIYFGIYDTNTSYPNGYFAF